MYSKMGIADLTENLKRIRVKITDFNNQAKSLTKDKEEIEKLLIDEMDKVNTDTISNAFGTFKRTATKMPQVEDWEAVHKYIRENDAFYLMYKRIGQVAYQELIDAGSTVPGINTYTKNGISVYKPKKSFSAP